MDTGGVVKTCQACGAPAVADDAFCGECGASLPPAEPAPAKASVRAQVSAASYVVRTCPNCSRELTTDTTVCLSCGYELQEHPLVALEHTAGEWVENARDLIPGSPVVLGHGERVWRRYEVMGWPPLRVFGITISRVTGRGTLYVTDSRVLFYASLTQRRGRASALIQETQLQHVTGLMAYVSRSWSWFGFMLTLLIGLVGYAALTGGHALIGIVLLALAAAGVSLLLTGLALRGTVGVRLTSSAAQSSPLGFGALGDPRGGFWRSLLGPFGAVITLIWGPRDATDLLLAMPGPDAERVIVELGALIADLQVRGSLAETHWGRDPEPEDGT